MENNVQIKTLSKKQLDSIPILLTADSVIDGVKQIGIARSTFYNWLKIPEYIEELNFQKRELVRSAMIELKTSTTKAVQVLKKLLNSKNEMIRLRTATTILDFTKDFLEQEEIQQRLDKLEEKIGDR